MRRLSARHQLKHTAGITVLLASGLLPGLACGGNDKSDKSDQTGEEQPKVVTGTMNVTANFPTDAAQTTTASVHVWIIKAGGDTTCAALVGGDVDPYDLQHDRLADVVSTDPSQPVDATAAVGTALVYVEGVDYSGKTEWAGCKQVDVTANGGSLTIDLGRYKIFDCGNPETADGSPCDDGLNCTVGETCKNGQCQGGSQRNCDHVADACNAAQCDEEAGCIAVALPDTTPCDDEVPCTMNEVCQMGVCVGVPRDCGAEATQCETAIGCDQLTGECMFDYATYRTPCDDGQYCTDGDYCDGGGTCISGGARDCAGNGCATGTCDETNDACVTTTNQPAGTPCSDACQTGELCDGNGQCVGTPVDCSYLDYGDCEVGVCNPTYGCETEYAPQGTPCTYTGGGNSDCYAAGVCNGSGSCTANYMPYGTPCIPTTGDADCYVGSICDGYGYCSGSYVAYGTPCDDGNPCTTGDYCSYGSCTYSSSYPDVDGDGYYDYACYPYSTGDCDDNDPAVHPYATEICGDGIDNDCDTYVDAADPSGCTTLP